MATRNSNLGYAILSRCITVEIEVEISTPPKKFSLEKIFLLNKSNSNDESQRSTTTDFGADQRKPTDRRSTDALFVLDSEKNRCCFRPRELHVVPNLR